MSEPDDISDLSGMELFEKKVDKVWIMGGKFTNQGEKEFNFSYTPFACKAASLVLEINESHPIADKLIALSEQNDGGRVEKYAKILYSQARLISGLSIENPTEIASLIAELM